MAEMAAPVVRLPELTLSQYRNSPNYLKYLAVYTEEMQDIHESLQECLSERYYDIAVGAQLDVIGHIVGASRVLKGVVVSGHFGYLDVAEALGMGREDDPQLGGPLRGDREDEVQDIELSDPMYRAWIDARIVKNQTNCNIEDTISFFVFMLNDSEVDITVTEPAPATVRVDIDKTLSIHEAALIKSMAQHCKPIGVTLIVADRTGIIGTLPIPILD